MITESRTAMMPVACDPDDEQLALDPKGRLLVRDAQGFWALADQHQR